MVYWNKYVGHKPDLQGKRKKFDNTIYCFDIETTSFLVLDNNIIEASKYLELTKDEQNLSEFYSNMYIWMLSINEVVYYGRTFDELDSFLNRIEKLATPEKKIVYVHNLPFEFEFLRNKFKFKKVFARKARKPIRFELEDYNFEFRCSLMLTNVALEKLPKIFNLNVKKLVGNLNYDLLRNSKTKLSKKEFDYCENDCLVIYEYLKMQLETYKTLKAIPLTSTGFVRKELKDKTIKDYLYRNKVRRSINTDGHIYNLLISAFAGGYTHSNWTLTDEIIQNVVSYDETSAYPYVMTTCKFPSTEFIKINLTEFSQMKDCFAYLIHVRFKEIQCKYYNNFISQNKCKKIVKGAYDNGRIISAKEIEIIVTDVDLKLIIDSYDFESYEIIEAYYSLYDYLPKQLIEFILEKYVKKTQYKNVEGKEVEYALEKGKFNSIYGMSVTNNIKDEVIFDNEAGWKEEELTNEIIQEKLLKEKKDAFLSFSYGVWVTAYARYNLLKNLMQLDKYVIYADTDSLKLKQGFDINIIKDYNNSVRDKIKKVCDELEIDFEKYEPEDKKGKKHCLGLFELDAEYKEFITQGAKKYAYKDNNDEIHITVAGVPKKGAKALKNLKEFKDDFVFEHKDTGKNLLIYSEEMKEIELVDYQGNKEVLKNRYGCVIVPTTYVLGKSEEYSYLISDESSKRAIFKEVSK